MKKVDARTIQAGNFPAPSVQSRPCTKELPLVWPGRAWGVTEGKKTLYRTGWKAWRPFATHA